MAEPRIDAWTRFMARSIGLFFPGAARRFLGHRLALDHYTGATVSGPNQAWRPSNKSADAILKQSAKLLRSRSRDLVRNSGHVSGAVKTVCNNVIFKGFKPQSENQDFEAGWKAWTRAVSWHEKERLVLRHLWMDGEILIHFYLSPTLRNKGVLPLGIELLECDHLDESVHGDMGNGNTAKRGIEYNAEGWPVYYHLFQEHPGDSMWATYGKKRRIPAREIEHIFVKDRASQNRGEPWLTPIIMEVKDLEEYKSSERLAARLAAAFGVFVKSNIPEALTENFLGGDGETVSTSSYSGPDYLEPGRIQPLPPGTDIATAKVDRPGQNYEPYLKSSHRDQAAGIGMSYEAYSKDYTGASYSSARSAALEERRGYQVQQVLLIHQMHAPILDRFQALAELMDEPWSGQDLGIKWQVPGWPWVDPDKDSKGAERDIKMEVSSRHIVCANRGEDYDEVQEDLQQEAKDGYGQQQE